MKRTRFRRVTMVLTFGAAILIFSGVLLSRWAGSARAHSQLTARLEQVFGRPVEVGHYDLRLFPAPGIEAQEVTISEDPRFGQDYFLRAESVDANLRLASLLALRLELGTLKFKNPSLNLVRTSEGKWNVESWLPAPQGQALAPTAGSKTAQGALPIAHLRKIEIDGGRINVKRGVDVRPFALADVHGSIQQESPNRWRIALSAQPLRATVHLQEAGTVRLEGDIAGTSARLQPAQLALTWSDASVADALRLLAGSDSGVRGGLQLQFTAHTEPNLASGAGAPARWVFTLGAALSGLHRWDLSSRADDPPVSIRANGSWQAGAPELAVNQLLIEGEHSKIVAAGSVDWRTAITPSLTISPSNVSWSDLLAVYRAFWPGLDDGLTADGLVRVSGSLHGWSPQSVDASAQSDEAFLRLGNAPLLQLARFNLKAASADGPSSLSFVLRAHREVPISPPDARAAHYADEVPDLWVLASAGPASSTPRQKTPPARVYAIRMDGQLDHFELWLAAARALGRPLNAGWEAQGGLDMHLAWQWIAGEPIPRPSGVVAARNLAVRVPFLNRPVELAAARLELAPGQRRITLTRAAAFGAHWQGSVSWKESGAPAWEFDLAADRLDAAELDRWLGPRARPGWLARLFSSSAPQQFAPALPGSLLARGKLRADSFVLAPIEAQNVRADIELDGRALDVQQLSARFYGGNITGSLEAKLTADPVYRFLGRLDGVNAAALAGTSAVLKARLAGTLAGAVQFSAQGIGRDNLLASLEGRGNLAVSDAEVDGLDLGASQADSGIGRGGRYSSVRAAFFVGGRAIQLQSLVLAGTKEVYQGDGTVDFARRLVLNLRPVAPAMPPATPSVTLAAAGDRTPMDLRDLPTRLIHVSGLIEAPRISTEEPPQAAVHAPSPSSHR
jgi:hypothetical protein